LSCPGATDNSDYRELLEVLSRSFRAQNRGELVGPYSVHQFFKAEGLDFVVILDDLGFLDFYAKDQRDTPALESLMNRLLTALNAGEGCS
jgi:hypothetical protein